MVIPRTSSAAAYRGGSASSVLGGGSTQIGIVGGVINTNQDYLNTLQSRANVRGTGGISTAQLNSAYELGIEIGYRFSGTIITALLRPSIFYEKQNGGNSTGSFDYGVQGFTVFPILRLYPLENDFVKFFIQFGLGYGSATTTVQESQANLTAQGSAFGTLTGLGAEFCFTASHCMTVEANYRYLIMERNIVTESGGTFASGSVSNATVNQEFEIDGTDATVRMSGLQFLGGYTYHF